MSTATTAPDITVPTLGGRHHFLLRRLHSLTGLVFGGYIVIHLLVNATLAEPMRGKEHVFDMQVAKIHSLPFLVLVEFLLIYLPIIYHTVYGIWITLTGQPNVNHYPYGKNVFYLLQRVSAIIIFLFLIFHVLGMKGLFGPRLEFAPDYPTQSAAYHFQASWAIPYIIYPIGIIASCYHLANGFWTAGITWGLTVSRDSQKRWGYVCSGLFVVTLVLGALALYGVLQVPVVQHPEWLPTK